MSDRVTMMEDALHFARIAYDLKCQECDKLKRTLDEVSARYAELIHLCRDICREPSMTFTYDTTTPAAVNRG